MPTTLRHLHLGHGLDPGSLADCRRSQHEPESGYIPSPYQQRYTMITRWLRDIVGPIAVTAAVLGFPLAAVAQPRSGEAIIAWHVTLAPSWFDPATAPPQITAFGILYAIHDALLRPLPGQKIGNSLAETWTESADG